MELDLNEQQRRAVRWFYSPAGQTYLAVEQAAINRQLAPIYGVHLAQLGILDDAALYSASQVTHCFSMGERLSSRAKHGCITEWHRLPLEQHSVDCVLLHHVLEFSPDPHALLREAARIVRPEGHILIAQFNPYSVFAAQHRLSWRLRKSAWRSRSPGALKLSDWLRLLDFSMQAVEYCWHLPVVRNASLAKKLLRWERPFHRITSPFGASTILLAKKRNSSLTPVRRRWSELPSSLGVPIMKPSTRAAMDSKENV